MISGYARLFAEKPGFSVMVGKLIAAAPLAEA